MGLKKTHKTKKVNKQKGRGMGTYGRGARKAGKDAGHKGGLGMAGSGKRADHKKLSVIKKYGNNYFGKMGATSKSNAKDKSDRINLRDIENKKEKIGKNTSKGWEINLKSYKVLGVGEINSKLIIKAKSASKSAIEKVGAAGGKIILPGKEETEEKSKDKESKESSKKKSGEGKQEKGEKSEKKK